MEIDTDKITAMQTWPSLKSLKEFQGFLGLLGYYSRFVKGYGEITRPLTDELKKDGFKWSTIVEKAFLQLKMAMSSILVLALLDFTRPFILDTDASRHGLGAVLM